MTQLQRRRSVRNLGLVEPIDDVVVEPLETSPPPSPETKKLKLDIKRNVQKQAFNELLTLMAANGGNGAQYGSIQKIITKYHKTGCLFITRRNLEYRMTLHRAGKEFVTERSIPTNVVLGTSCTTGVSDLTSVSFEEINNGNLLNEDSRSENHKTSSSKHNRKKEAVVVKELTTKVAEQYSSLRAIASASGKRVRKGVLNELISSGESSAGLSVGALSKKTVLSRINRQNFDGTAHQRKSPLEEIERVVVDACIKLAEIGNALTKYAVISLMEEIIEGTEYEQHLLDYKTKRKITSKIIGKGWYGGFIKRNASKIKRGRCKVRDQKRLTWCTKENFQCMYDSVYERMVSAGVAEKLDHEIMFDKNGDEVSDDSKMVGRKTRYRLTKPSNVVFVDETGCNTNQKTDGYVGGRLHIIPTNATESGITGSVTDIHFTVLCFSSGNGDPLMCAIIMKSNKDISHMPKVWKLGIDRRKEYFEGETDYELFEKNFGDEKAMPGGPKCFVNGKYVPCFVGCSPKASITSQLLAQMLTQLDSLNVLERSENVQPFLLLDGHHSRMQLPFLEYINNINNRWTVCIGVPYGTHIWQVADSSQQNGIFKLELSKAKELYLSQQPSSKKRFLPTDIIPLVNMAWGKSFANAKNCQKAIRERGWGPLNYCLLDHPDLQKQQEVIEPVQLQANKEGPLFNGYLDIIIDQEMKNKGRRLLYLKHKEEHEHREVLLQKLKKATTTLTSGNLVSHRQFCLSDVEYLEHAKQKQQDIDTTERLKRKRKLLQETKDNVRFEIAVKKIKSNHELIRDDLKSLIKKVKKKTDSPMKSKMNELRTQWKSRRHRINHLFVGVEDGIFDGIFLDTITNENVGTCTTDTNNIYITTPEQPLSTEAVVLDSIHSHHPHGNANAPSCIDNRNVTVQVPSPKFDDSRATCINESTKAIKTEE